MNETVAFTTITLLTFLSLHHVLAHLFLVTMKISPEKFVNGLAVGIPESSTWVSASLHRQKGGSKRCWCLSWHNPSCRWQAEIHTNHKTSGSPGQVLFHRGLDETAAGHSEFTKACNEGVLLSKVMGHAVCNGCDLSRSLTMVLLVICSFWSVRAIPQSWQCKILPKMLE